MRIIVIGGTGFIGRHVVRHMVEAGHRVLVFHRGRTEADLPQDVQHVRSRDISTAIHHFPEQTLRFAPDVVVHMIAMTQQDARLAVQTFRGHAGRLVTLSSGDVYRAYGRFTGLEPGPAEAVPLRESSPLRTVLYPYREKASSHEDMLYNYEKIWVEREVLSDASLPGTVLRLPKVYGPGGNAEFATVRRYRNHPNWRWTHGYVENIAAAITLVVTHPKAGGQIFHVGEEATPTIEQRLADLPSSDMSIDESSNFDFQQDIVYDTNKIRNELGYGEIVPYLEGIRKTIDSVRG